MIPLASPAPDFILPDAVSGKTLSLAALKGANATVVMFICNHCPYVKHINPELVRLGDEYASKGVSFIAINSNDIVAEPEDAPDEMKKVASALNYPFPYLFDETQQVARAYDSACTPDFFIFDKELKLAYRGQLDDSRPSNNVPLSGKDIREALDALLSGKAVSPRQRPSIGCNIKWKV
jgi:thiol-disulfide isomerase/thioredoxin